MRGCCEGEVHRLRGAIRGSELGEEILHAAEGETFGEVDGL